MQKLESIVLPHVETCFRVVKWLQCLKKGINNLFQSLVNLDELRTAVLLCTTLFVLVGFFQSQKRTLLLGSTLRLVFSVASQPSSKSSEDSVVNLRKLSTPFIDFSTTLLVLSVGVRSESSCSHLRQYWSPPPFLPISTQVLLMARKFCNHPCHHVDSQAHFFQNTGCSAGTDKNYWLIARARKQPISFDRCPFFH